MRSETDPTAPGGVNQDELRSRCVSLFRFLRDLTALRTTQTRTVDDYDHVLWFDTIPHQPEIDSIVTRAPASGRADPGPDDLEPEEDFDDESRSPRGDAHWLEVQRPRREPHPEPPAALEPWIDAGSLEDSHRECPATREFARPEDSEQLDSTPLVAFADATEAQRAFDYYVTERWRPWALEDRRRESIQKVYATLFAMHQRQQRLGEDYQVALGLGLLTWVDERDGAGPIRRHLVTADAAVDVDSSSGTIRVGPGPDGAQPRLEQDMLDPASRPRPERVREFERWIADLGDAVWSPDDVAEVGSAWVHEVSHDGEYLDRLAPPTTRELRGSRAPRVAFAPALLLRRRSDRSLLRCYGEILGQLDAGGAIPFGIARFVDILEDAATPSDDASESVLASKAERDYLPLPTNDEQLAILDRLRKQRGVLVQGPPGTGKSHTIANLVCHLLATGQRVLVTSHTARALEVLRDKLPGSFADLCVDLLGAGRDAMHSLERSVQAITERHQAFDVGLSEQQIDALESALQSAREDHARALRALQDLQEVQARGGSFEFEGRTYAGTPQLIAATLERERERPDIGWIDDALGESSALPLDDHELAELVDTVPSPAPPDAWLHADRRDHIPDDWLAAFEFERELATVEDLPAEPSALDEIDDLDALARIVDLAQRLDTQFRACLSHPQPWVGTAAQAVLNGDSTAWRTRLEATEREVDAGLRARADAADARAIRGPALDLDDTRVAADAERLRAHLVAGHGLGFWIVRSKLAKETRYLWESTTVDGVPCANPTALEALIDTHSTDRALARLEGLWQGVARLSGGSTVENSNRTVQAASLADRIAPLRQAVELETVRAELVATWTPHASSPVAWHDADQVTAFAQNGQRVLDAARLQRTRRELEAAIALCASTEHPDVQRVADALCTRDADALRTRCERMRSIVADHGRLDRIRQAGAPHAADLLADSDCGAVRRASLRAAWAHARARAFVSARLESDREQELRTVLEQRADTERESLAALAQARAWHSLLARLTEHQRQHLVAWTKAMRRIGKGTGKHAGRHRRAAREHMEECRTAIPAWILPMYRVAESIRPGVDAFDVVIVDEASQSGPEALFLLYLTEKILVVGDDKQISPDYVGITRDDVEHLRRRHLDTLPHADAFSLEHSLFDLAEIRYGNRVRLREHFRCMPEIIRFSNDLCYRAEPLIPLKQFGAGRLTPVIETRFVEGGYRDGTADKVFNPVEADAIVEQVAACDADPRYQGKSFGVISLQGRHQSAWIEGKLLERLGPDTVLARQLVCGDAYAFQGDERDVMFLSLVAAPHPERRIGTLADQRSERRFNVAVSRAREQLWLFHSVTLADLSPKCLRHALLEYCLDPRATAKSIDDEASRVDSEALREATRTTDLTDRTPPPAPFDSWFEVDVCLELLAHGFRVEPQFVVAGYHIDLVVIGDTRRLAIECDGDAWHGAEQWAADEARQRALERCGWTFERVRGSAFYLDRTTAMAPVLERLAALDIGHAVRASRR